MSGGMAVKERKKATLVVLYNGVARAIEVQETASMQSVLSRAMAEFGIVGQPDHGLFTEQNVEIDTGQSVSDAGLVDGQRVVLRSRVVRAGVLGEA